MLSIDTYDEFGKPGASNQGRFQYTGQKWLPELGLYDYKARTYAPALGRFLQTDPIDYGSGPNLYAYVRGDPVNLTDPLGLEPPIVICGNCGSGSGGGDGGGFGIGPPSVGFEPPEGVTDTSRYGPPPCFGNCSPIVITAHRRSLVTRAVNATGDLLDELADDFLAPPAPQGPNESYSHCVARMTGDPRVAAGAAAAVASGANIAPYPRAVAPGGSGTSIISTISRYVLSWVPRMGDTRIMGTNSVGGAIGRIGSTAAVIGGAGTLAHLAGRGLGGATVCR